MALGGQHNLSSNDTAYQNGRRDKDNGAKWDHVITAVLLIWFFFGMAIIFADLWVPTIPYIQYGNEVVGDPVFFMLSLTMVLSILWNISFYLKRRQELRVARKLIRWVASQRNTTLRTDREMERIDRVLKGAIWALSNRENIKDVVDGLQEGTRDGEALPERWARPHYDMAIERLMDAAGRDMVLNWEERDRDLQESMKMLWATRAEYLKAMYIE